MVHYEFPVETVLEWLADPPLPDEQNEYSMQRALIELEVREARLDLDGHSSTSLQRIGQQLETALADLRRRRHEHEEEQRRQQGSAEKITSRHHWFVVASNLAG